MKERAAVRKKKSEKQTGIHGRYALLQLVKVVNEKGCHVALFALKEAEQPLVRKQPFLCVLRERAEDQEGEKE
jgi:hypothetical protein